MSVIKLLSSSLGVLSDIPNQKLAEEIVVSLNNDAIKELVENLQFNNDKKIQSDCIKVLYEIGYKKPELIVGFLTIFVKLLKNKNNRLIWGSMIAIGVISKISPQQVYLYLSEIMQAVDNGSVITKDAGVEILANLASHILYHENCFPLLLEQLKTCPAKQLGQYSEKAIKAVNTNNKEEFINLLNSRIKEIESDAQRKSISTVLKKFANLK